MLALKRTRQSGKYEKNNEPIILIYQYFKHPDNTRHNEIKTCLIKNVNNSFISRIILLNERKYTEEELGVNSNKVEQIIIGNRLYFSDIFDYVEKLNLKGYILTCNADIFFDETVEHVKNTNIHKEKGMYTQLRFEYTNKNLKKCKLFGPRSDSQDTWIFHSNFNIPKLHRKIFKIHFGMPGCDNKLTYLFHLMNFEVLNDPYLIKTYHFHRTEIRNYKGKAPLPRPYMFVNPYLNPNNAEEMYPMNVYCKPYGMTYRDYYQKENNFFEDADMTQFTKLVQNKSFYIGKLNIHFSNMAFILNELLKNDDNKLAMLKNNIIGSIQYFKDNKLIINNLNDVNMFVSIYNDLLKNLNAVIMYPCRFYDYLTLKDSNNKYHIQTGDLGNGYMLKRVRKINILPIGVNLLNIGVYMNKPSWLDHINNKKILIISNKFEKIKEQIHKKGMKNTFYGKEIFENSTYSIINTPNSNVVENIQDNINNYYQNNIKEINNCDVIFIGETPYDIILVDIAKKLNKSTIVVGEFLPLWFGLYSKKDLKLNSEVIKMYMDKDWSMV